MRAQAAMMGALALMAAGCGGASASRPSQPAPWGALTSPTAAMRIVFSDVCMTAVKSGGSVEALALDHWLRPVPPRSTGSPTAIGAWRLASYSNIYVMALPDGGCSASVEAGEPDGLQRAAVALLARHGDFTEGQTVPGEDHSRTAWCTQEERRPMVAVFVKRTSGRRHAFLANVFHAKDARPSFCAPTT